MRSGKQRSGGMCGGVFVFFCLARRRSSSASDVRRRRRRRARQSETVTDACVGVEPLAQQPNIGVAFSNGDDREDACMCERVRARSSVSCRRSSDVENPMSVGGWSLTCVSNLPCVRERERVTPTEGQNSISPCALVCVCARNLCVYVYDVMFFFFGYYNIIVSVSSSNSCVCICSFGNPFWLPRDMILIFKFLWHVIKKPKRT